MGDEKLRKAGMAAHRTVGKSRYFQSVHRCVWHWREGTKEEESFWRVIISEAVKAVCGCLGMLTKPQKDDTNCHHVIHNLDHWRKKESQFWLPLALQHSFFHFDISKTKLNVTQREETPIYGIKLQITFEVPRDFTTREGDRQKKGIRM